MIVGKAVVVSALSKKWCPSLIKSGNINQENPDLLGQFEDKHHLCSSQLSGE
jgi:hypothetical protein